LKNNILYGSTDKGDAHFQRVVQAALIEEFAQSHPDGYEQLIGENGAKLSGGQQQRVAIARALYKDAPILLLDEATSALDSQSEGKIQHALDALFENRTALIIAHRLSTITNADLIMVFEQGKLIERGTHAELLSNKGAYANLVKVQQRDKSDT
ncbi:MAG: ABC-type multidrug transport system fused ATPase/permease subunit, partial [Gammaproteobacteria bacterium]